MATRSDDLEALRAHDDATDTSADGIKVTALMREWVEAGMADAAADDAVVSVRELRHALASAQTVQQWAALRTGGAAASEVGTQRVAHLR